MYLTLDFGNTQAKFALFSEQGELVDNGLFQDAAQFQHLPIQQAIFATVRKEIPFLTSLPCPIHLFNTSMKLPLTIQYQTPHTLGPDRLAATLGAQKLSPENTPILTIDAGTCITYDWLTPTREYIGGAISPGMHMRYIALHQQTGKLPLVSHESFQNPFGTSTNESILCGVQQGIIGEINHQIDLFNEKYPQARIYITGGDAMFLAEHIKSEIFVEPLLIHHGLFHALQYNEIQ